MTRLTNKPPSRAALARLIEDCIKERHRLTFTMNPDEVKKALGEMDYDKLLDLAFFSITDLEDENRHKEIFIDRCKEAGIQ